MTQKELRKVRLLAVARGIEVTITHLQDGDGTLMAQDKNMTPMQYLHLLAVELVGIAEGG